MHLGCHSAPFHTTAQPGGTLPYTKILELRAVKCESMVRVGSLPEGRKEILHVMG